MHGFLFAGWVFLLSQETTKVDYNRDVRPILSNACFGCHGQDARVREADLRLDVREDALKERKGIRAIVPGDAAKSELVRRITHAGDDRMPPAKSRKSLTPAQIETLQRWIVQGAVYAPHWAYIPPRAKEGSTLDSLILERLHAAGLRPSPEAPRRTLIRRAVYDLTGLPPTPEEVEAFAGDPAPDAYEKMIDRLLESPRYGEKWGRHWLDLVRYAETNGYERDGDKPHAWRYRDYVIRSFNEDKPYDRFLKEQLAGDEMQPRTADAITATGFYRLGLWDDEPADRELARYDGLDDIVSTVSQVMLAMTMGCARCHDHKRDPIPQEDYYRMLAFFHYVTPMANGGPGIVTVLSRNEPAHKLHAEEIRKLQEQADAIEGAFARQLPASPDELAGIDLEDLTYRVYYDTWNTLPKFDDLLHEAEGTLAHNLFDLSPAKRPGDFGFVFTGNLVVPRNGLYKFYLDSDDGSRILVNGKTVIQHDGVHTLGSPPRRGEIELQQGRVPIRLEYFQASAAHALVAEWSGPGVPRRMLSKSKLDDKGFAKSIKTRGIEILGKETYETYERLKKSIDDLKKNPPKDESALSVTERGGVQETFVLRRGNPLMKGDKVEPGFPRILGASAPETAKPAAGRTTGRRTALAEWIASPRNPLTARVMANRLWQHHFGRGIVPTSNDYGMLGEPPTHPELLDLLAAEMVARGWKLKAMHKLIMTSNAYRMSSRDDAAALARDPGNDLFWRFNMRRLTAEELRDSILAVNGTLNLKMGGPSVLPPMPREVLETSSQPGKVWVASPPEDAARRSVYIKVKRSLLPPLMAGHDFPDTDSSCAVRFSTTVPTQALTLLNSVFLNEQAAIFAQRLMKEAPGDADRQVRLALHAVTQRPPTALEVRRGMSLIEDLRKDGLNHEKALSCFCLTALNLNEFVYLD